jgi:hypothetical protein
MYKAWWGSFSDWLVQVQRSVMAGEQPDPNGVWSQEPDWQDRMAAFIQGPVRDTIGLAYERLLGPGYQFDARPAVTTHLAQVRNRMVRTPETVYDTIAATIARGAGNGDSIPTIASRVSTVLTATGTEEWRNRATTVARTETISALGAGRADAHAAVAEVLGPDGLEQQWLSTLDARTRLHHAAADGLRTPVGQPFVVGGEPLMYPGDPAGSASNVINCIAGGTRVEFPALRAVTRRWYEGDVVELRFASGDHLTVTPNHPILRADGRWTAAGLLRKGDYCVSGSGLDGAFGAPDEDGRPPQVGQLYRAADQLRHPERVAVSPPDFHGDGLDGEVDVVAVDRYLGVHPDPATDEQVEQFGLALADEARARVRASDSLPMPAQRPDGNRPRYVAAASGGVGGGGVGLPLLVREPGHAQQHGLAASAWRDAEVGEASHHSGPGNAKRLRHGEDALPTFVSGAKVGLVDRHSPVQADRFADAAEPDTCGAEALRDGGGRAIESGGEGRCGFPRFVSTAQVVDVDRHAFAGHVFNLDTGEGWYIANGIALRNCRCSTLLVEKGEEVDQTGRGFKDEDEWWASQVEEAAVVGPAMPSRDARLLSAIHADASTPAGRKAAKAQLAAGINGRYAGLDVEVTHASGYAGRLGYSGTIKDPATGTSVGKFARLVDRDSDGRLYAVHDHLEIKRKYQGSGFQAEFNGNLIDWYRRSGVEYVKVGANIDVGGYAWARAGYDFADDHSALTLYTMLHGQLLEIDGQPRRALRWLDDAHTTPSYVWDGPVVFEAKPAWTQAKLRKTFAGASDAEIERQLDIGRRFVESLEGRTFGVDLPSAYELSQLGRWPGAGKDDVWIGKEIMLGSSWLGVLRL